MRERQSLNGLWDYRIGEGSFTKKVVPFSALPVGKSECVLHFPAEVRENKRAFLVFEGITYAAKVTLNGTCLGDLLAYAEYRFEITHLLKKENTLSVELFDFDPAFGPSEGWENYGGIIRDVYIEYTGQTVIGDYLWNGALNSDYSRADCTVEIPLDGETEGAVTCALLRNTHGRIVGEGTAEHGKIKFSVDEPELWSPDHPYLYRLECAVSVNGIETDRVSMAVGFKDFTKKGKRFYLNGEAIFLLGVNRHDIWGDCGHTLSEEQMRKDMQMIKDTGINYVRLVHYPHHRRIVELADEIGLLVSEEPGLWWSDMNNKEICDGALEVMRRTVLRDRNHISIAFWLSFNECIFTLDYLKDSVRVCRENDPYHMVSGANCMSIEMTKEYYPICGFDFYTMHPYDSTTKRMEDSANALTEMPLLLTEWGGYFCRDNPFLFRRFIKYIISTWNNSEDQPVIAGATYWFWAEMNEFTRSFPACENGVLREALVDAHRNPLPDLDVFRNAFAELKNPPEVKKYGFQSVYTVSEDGEYEAIDISGVWSENEATDAWKAMIEESLVPIPRFHHANKKTRKIKSGPILPENVYFIGKLPVNLRCRPYVLSEQNTLTVPFNTRASRIYIIGNTSMPKGFPIGGRYGETAAEYIVEYVDGTTERHALRNGYEITTATALHGPSRINPIAANSPRAFAFHYQYDTEHYVVNLGCIETDPQKEIRNVTLAETGNGYRILVYGISIKK